MLSMLPSSQVCIRGYVVDAQMMFSSTAMGKLMVFNRINTTNLSLSHSQRPCRFQAEIRQVLSPQDNNISSFASKVLISQNSEICN